MQTQTEYRPVNALGLETLVATLFVRVGAREADATGLAHDLVDADLRGVHSHGCRFVMDYLKNCRSGGYNLRADLALIRDGGSTVLADGQRGFGHVMGARAMALAIERARTHGVGIVLLQNGTHNGALAYFTQAAADAGCIGFATTGGGVSMVPPGGREKLVGLNPLSWSAPTNRPWALNLDMATSVAAGSKLLLAKQRGEKIPLGWAVGPDGDPTDDPDLGLQGGLLPMAGYKGYGLALMLDVVSGLLGGGRFGGNLGNGSSIQHYQAIDVERFMPLDEFKGRMDQLIDQLKGSGPATGSRGVFLPGEVEYQLKQERLANGIPLDSYTRDGIRNEAREAGLTYDVEM